MRALGLALCLSVTATGAAVARDAQVSNPSPVDFSKPFLTDGVSNRPTLRQDTALPVEVIAAVAEERLPVEIIRREDLLPQDRRGPDTKARHPVYPDLTPRPQCFVSVSETFDIESRAISCEGAIYILR